MPIGKKYVPPPQPQQENVKRVIRLPVVTRHGPLSKWSVIPPEPKPGSKQLTCIRHDENGQYFVDEYVERAGTVLASLPEDRRFMTHLSCPKFQFQVSIAACHRYCSYPCSDHVRTIQENVWYRRGGKPMLREKGDRRGATAQTGTKARGKNEADDI